MSAHTIPIGNLEVIPVRKAFPHEALHFTSWLEKNIDSLSDRLGLKLTVQQKEKSVGDFKVDLLCVDDSGRRVIVENQLERTDHSHLGQILTYLVNLEAKTAIWVTTDPRPEHHKVVDWLNESTAADTSFYLLKVEAVRIADSPYAPFFTILAAPDSQSKQIGANKKEWADAEQKLFQFWQGLLERSKSKTTLFSNISPSRYRWISTGAGLSGVTFQYNIGKNSGFPGLYIDHDKKIPGKGNKKIFDILFKQKSRIEAQLGFPLQWDRLNDARASWIWYDIPIGGLAQPDTWPKLHDKMIDAMVKFDKVFRPLLAQIKL